MSNERKYAVELSLTDMLVINNALRLKRKIDDMEREQAIEKNDVALAKFLLEGMSMCETLIETFNYHINSILRKE